MRDKRSLTEGNVTKVLISFTVPFLLACFMQMFYGLVDLYVVGLFCEKQVTAAVSIGSQMMHMLTVIIVGFAMGLTVSIGRGYGRKDWDEVKKTIGAGAVFFFFLAVISTFGLLACTEPVTSLLLTPMEAKKDTIIYLSICFAGIPFVVLYNVISSIFRGMGDSKCPMYFVGVACIVNVILDFVFIGKFHMGAAGAAFGTIIGQGISSVVGVFVFKVYKKEYAIRWKDIRLHTPVLRKILKIGAPIAVQDGLIQVAFMVITVIANSRGLVDSTGVGIVEKIISFLFLVPSALLSSISAITAQNMGAGKGQRARETLYRGLVFAIIYGGCIALYCQFFPETFVGRFTRDSQVLLAGCVYLQSYSFDVLFAGIHFCFSGYFCGDEKSIISFIHNFVAIVCIRIPGAYLAGKWFPDSLYPMGWAVAGGSVLSAVICIGFFVYYRKGGKLK